MLSFVHEILILALTSHRYALFVIEEDEDNEKDEFDIAIKNDKKKEIKKRTRI